MSYIFAYFSWMYWRKKLYIIIFGTNTKAGKLFDLVLLWVIIASVLLVMMETGWNQIMVSCCSTTWNGASRFCSP